MRSARETILVIEDEAVLLRAITIKLAKNNFETVSCTGGKQALDYLEALPEPPDLIWLDYYLKDMDGLAFMHALRKDPRYKEVPLIVVSNSASPEKVHHMLALGAKQYLLKSQHRLEDIMKIIKTSVLK